MSLAVVAILAVLTVSVFAAGIYSTVVDIFSNEAHVPAVERVRSLPTEGFQARSSALLPLASWRAGPDPEETWWWRQDAEDAEDGDYRMKRRGTIRTRISRHKPSTA